MFIVTVVILLRFVLVVFLKVVSFLLSEKVVLNREELSAYECGFEHYNVSRVPFSLRYYFLTLIFLLFDLEIVFLLFLPFFLSSGYFFLCLFIGSFFLFILFLSLIYE
jgi:NADH-ubiquinone oxidoreductase chain 3